MERIRSHFELRVYQFARAAAIKVFNAAKKFPSGERFDLVQQFIRSSRGVCANIAEAWRKRRYPAALIVKLNDAEAEAAETQCWADLAEGYGYIDKATRADIVASYEVVLGQLVTMANQAPKWTAGAPGNHPVSQSPSPKLSSPP